MRNLLDFWNVVLARGEGKAKLIETKCLELQLDMNMCKGQEYDGAGNMAGYCNVAVKVIKPGASQSQTSMHLAS